MKTSLKLFFLLAAVGAFIWACSSNDDVTQMMGDDVSVTDDVDPSDDDPGNTSSGEFELVDVMINLPPDSNLDLNGSSIVSIGQSVPVENNIAANVAFNSGTIELAYLLDSDQNLILAGFVSDQTKEISVETTAGVLLYFGMVSSLRSPDYKTFFIENIDKQEPFQQFVKNLENMFNQNSLVVSQGGHIDELNNTILALSEKEVIDVGNKIEFGTLGSSGLELNEVNDKSFNVTNNYPRRTHAFLYKKSFKNLVGEETVINSEIEGNDTPDREMVVPYISISDERDGNEGRFNNFSLCSQGARYAAKTSDDFTFELPDDRASETYELSVVGPGMDNASEREMTNLEREKFEELSVETFVLDYFIPVLMDVGGNRNLYSAKALQSAKDLTKSVEPILRAHEPTLNAVLANDFETAIKEFLPFLYEDVRLSNDLRNIMKDLYGIISDGNSPNTFIQNNELVEDGEERFLKISRSILQSLKESTAISCINKRLNSSAKLEKWDVTITEGLVKLKPEEMTTTPYAEGKEINARAYFDLQSGEEFEYEWSTTTQFGGVLYDLENDQNGTQFTSTSSKVSFISRASLAQLSEGENIETVSVKVFVVSGNSRDEIGEASMTVDIKKQKFIIKPDNVTIKGDDKVKLNLFSYDGVTIPNEETDYEVVWTTSGNHGLLSGYNISETNFNRGYTTYEAFDTEVERGTEKVRAQIYAKPKNSDSSFRLLHETEATINIENDENKLIYFVNTQIGSNEPALDGDWWSWGVWAYWEFDPTLAEADLPSGKEVERTHLQIIEPFNCAISKTWYPENQENDLSANDTYILVCGSTSGGGHRDTWETGQGSIQESFQSAIANANANRGYAQVTVYLRNKQ